MSRRSLAVCTSVALLTAPLLAVPPLLPDRAAAETATVLAAPTFARVSDRARATFDGDLYLVADDGVHGWEVWRTDGTSGGTTMVTDDLPASEWGIRLLPGPDRLFVLTGSGRVYAYDGAGAPVRVTGFGDRVPDGAESTIAAVVGDRLVLSGQGHRLFVVDAGSTTARSIDARYAAFEFGSRAAVLDGWMYFAGRDGDGGRILGVPDVGVELFRTDGERIELVADISAGAGSSLPEHLVTAGGRVFFTLHPEHTLWANDGTTGGTRRVAPGVAPDSLAELDLSVAGDEVVFANADESALWRSDGTAAGTREVVDAGAFGARQLSHLATIGPQVLALVDHFPTRSDRRALLVASDGVSGARAVAVLDGTYGEYGAAVVADGRAYVGGPSPFGHVLWRTDGTPEGTYVASRGAWDGSPETGPATDPGIRGVFTVGGRPVVASQLAPAPGAAPSGERRLVVVDPSVAGPVRHAVEAPRTSVREGRDGPEMTVSTGAWTPAPNVFTYQWFRNGRALPGATGPALDLRSVTGLRLSDRLHAVVRASGIGSPAATSRSAAVAPPRAGLPPVWPVDDPRLVGKARVGRRLRAVLDRVPTDALVSYQWRVEGRLVAGARGQRLRLTRAHLGRRVQAVVTVVRNGEDRHRALTPRSRPVRR